MIRVGGAVRCVIRAGRGILRCVSWLAYLIVSIGLTAVVTAVGVGGMLFRRGAFDVGRFPAAARLLRDVRRRFGSSWAWCGELPVAIRYARRKGSPGATWLVVRALRPAATGKVVLRSRDDWPDRAARSHEEGSPSALFDALFERKGEGARELDGWPVADARAALIRLLVAEAKPGRAAPYRDGRGARGSEGVSAIRVTVDGDGVTLAAKVGSLDDAFVERALQALLAAAELPAAAYSPYGSRRSKGSWSLLGGCVFWALVVLTVAGQQACFIEGVSGTIAARDTSWAGNDARLIVDTPEGRRPVWVPGGAYEICDAGALQREPFSLTVRCGGDSFLHLAFVGQVPFVLLMWLGSVLGVWVLAERAYENRRRRSTAPA